MLSPQGMGNRSTMTLVISMDQAISLHRMLLARRLCRVAETG